MSIPTRVWIREVGIREAWAILVGYPLNEWTKRPVLCKFGRHCWIDRHTWNGDAMAVEERWIECSRCDLWGGHTEYHGRSVPNPLCGADR